MLKALAIYPHFIDQKYIDSVVKQVKMAKLYGFGEIFTSIHLPEYTLRDQLKALKIIALETKKEKMELTVDIGGHFIKEVLTDEEMIKIVKDVKIDYLRLDYGFSEEEVKKLYLSFDIKGFVVNSSTHNEEEITRIIKLFKDIDENIQIRACHNYYILKNSGIDSAFAIKQDRIFEKFGIPVYYCIPTYSHPRQPLKLGLCTIEKHRFQSIDYILTDLVINHNLKAFMLADEWPNEQELDTVYKTLKVLKEDLPQQIDIKVQFYQDITDIEKNIVLGQHLIRYDSPFDNLRSISSRQMAETAKIIEPNNITEIHAGDIIIINKLNKRYSGELQIAMKGFSKSEGINVVGRIMHKEDLVKLWRFKEKNIYKFIE